MKQYTSTEQTAKLIELGFEKPKSILSYSYPVQSDKQKAYEESLGLEQYLATVDQIEFEYAYSIGELIEMLPTKIGAEVTDEYDSETAYLNIEEGWAVSYFNGWCTVEKYSRAPELIDALYAMILQLKGSGVI